MDLSIKLNEFKEAIDREIVKYLDKNIKEAEEKDIFISQALKYVKKMALSGGKRLRPAFMYHGYSLAGGKDKERIMKTAVSIELIHLFLLIHDDVIDRDDMRHGVKTLNSQYADLSRNMFLADDHGHYGNSMAIIVGDMVGALGNKIIFESGFPRDMVHKALSKLQDIISMTVIGQARDIYMEYRGKAAEDEILKMYEYKTAKYTVEGPLSLGAVLAGADDDLTERISAYAIPVGIAFQIQDDILGVFGSEKKIGKPVGSDIEEGKMTILVSKARDYASSEQKKAMDDILKKKSLTGRDVDIFRDVIRDSGSLDYAKELSRRYVETGRKALDDLPPSEAKDFLFAVAEYMGKREI